MTPLQSDKIIEPMYNWMTIKEITIELLLIGIISVRQAIEVRIEFNNRLLTFCKN